MTKVALSDILRLDNKAAIVTGGESVGRGIAERLIEAGTGVLRSVKRLITNAGAVRLDGDGPSPSNWTCQ